jgi:hypothetical protein
MADDVTPNRSYPIIDADDYIDTDWVTKLATLAGAIDTDIDALFTGKQDADARLAEIVDTGLTAAMFAADVADADGTLAANSDTRFATQKAVKTYADQLIASNDAMVFKGVIDCSANPNYPAADRGWTYKVSVAGKIGGASGKVVEVGDLLLCITDSTAAGNDATVGANWAISQANIDGAVTGPATAVSGRIASFNGTSGKVIQDSGYTIDQSVGSMSSPQFAAVELGHADDTTLSRVSAGVAAIEGKTILTTRAYFKANKNAVDQAGLTDGATTKLSFTNELSDIGGFYDAANSKWVPPAGPVRLSARATTSGVKAAGGVQIDIYKNGELLHAGPYYPMQTSNSHITCTDVANGSDYYEAFLYGDAITTLTVLGSVTGTWFEGHQI